MTYKQAKDCVAINMGYTGWEALMDFQLGEVVSVYTLLEQAAELYAASKMKWIRFEESRPVIGQEVWIVWPSGQYEPEWRKWTNQMDVSDWSNMRWLPIPDYKP